MSPEQIRETEREPASFRVRDMLLLALWFGLAYGLLEAAVLLGIYDFTHLLLWRNGVSSPVLWIDPLLNAGLFLGIGSVLGIAWWPFRRWRRRFAFAGALATFVLLVIFGLANAPAVVQPLGALALALAAAIQTFRWARKNAKFDFFRRSLAPLAAMVALAGVSSEAWVHRREQRFLSSLPAAQPDRPNVLLIVMDSCRADHLSAYGYGRPTPNLDRLASEGVLFENAFSPGTSNAGVGSVFS